MVEVLHIARGFYYTTVYNSLLNELINKCDFEVYVPQNEYRDRNIKEYSNHSFRVYSKKIIKRHDILTYHSKVKRMQLDLNSNFNITKFDMIHAHSWFTDGAVAYENFKKNRTPYIVAIRNTDINKYFKIGLHLRNYGYQILENAQKIIFISESYKNNVLNNLFPQQRTEKISDKVLVVPNGLDDFWIKNKEKKSGTNSEKIELIFVGKIDKNKNLESVINASLELERYFKSSKLNIVGDGELFEKMKEKYASENIIFHGKINSKFVLRDLYLSSDILVVPSFNETFGLAYIEAMSCGVPPIYSKGEGIDGQFKNELVGENINPHNPKTIVEKVIKIKNNYKEYSKNDVIAIQEYSWNNIADIYINIYRSIIEK